MDTPDPRIVYAERMADSIIVGFDDGRCALYSAALLHATLSQAEEVTEREDEEATDH